jgi:predicted GIY-YIG superfamily endonuclease
MFVYVLKLEQEKYYVGITKDENRINSHFNSTGSSWTKKYKPVSVIEKIDNADKTIEKNTTLNYMKLYGWRNVRGAGWTAIEIYCPKELR